MLPLNALFEQKLTTRVRGEIYILKNNKLILGKGKSGLLSIPGGAADPGETPQQAAVRETLEEVGISVHNIEPLNNVPFVIDFEKLYGDWNNVPQEVTRWGHNRFVTYSFKAYYNERDETLWKKSSDARDIVVIPKRDAIKHFKDRIKKLTEDEKHLKFRLEHSINMIRKL